MQEKPHEFHSQVRFARTRWPLDQSVLPKNRSDKAPALAMVQTCCFLQLAKVNFPQDAGGAWGNGQARDLEIGSKLRASRLSRA